MDRHLALRLIHPLVETDEITSGITLDTIAIERDSRDQRRDAIHLTFSSGMTLIITHRNNGGAAFKTTYFSVSLLQFNGPEQPLNQLVVDHFRTLLAENDTTPPTVGVDALPTVSKGIGGEVDLWLIPGHIGNPLDLSIRSLRILQSIDVVLIEAGSAGSVEQIFEQFTLGDLPRIVEISENRSLLKALLEDARSSGHCLGLFGANEGAPGLCDPGWMVLEVANTIAPSLVVRSISAGSALTTALMYADSEQNQFHFVGLFQNDTGRNPMLDAIGRRVPHGGPQTFIAFAEGTSLRDRWRALYRATRDLDGSIMLMANMSLSTEYVHRIGLSDMTPHPPDFLDPDDKVVLRVAFSLGVQPVRWLRRILMLPFGLWR